LQGFPNEEINKSEILDMVWAMRSFENINEDNVKELLQSDSCEVRFQHMTDRQCQCCRKTERKGGRENASEFRTAVWRSLNSSQKSYHYKLFLNINVSCVKK
jgi:hypothetical protein